MSSFRIEGGAKIMGDIQVQGSKNAALPLIAATLLTQEKCVIHNIPDIEDIRIMLGMLEKIGATVERSDHTLSIQNNTIDITQLPKEDAKKFRASVLFVGPLLARFGAVSLPYPGGDPIGRRSIDTHLDAFIDLGCEVERNQEGFTITYTGTSLPREVILNDFSVTATENVMMFLAGQTHAIDVFMVAQEPSVQNLQAMLSSMGATIQTFPYHHISVQGQDVLRGANIATFSDPIEAGTFVAMTLTVGGDVRILNFPTNDLRLVLHLIKHRGGNITQESDSIIRVQTSPNLVLKKIQTMIYPGFPTDLQAPFGTLATQTQGATIIHDPLFEGRLKYLKGLEKMGANIRIIDDHRAEIIGGTELKGAVLEGEDIRGSMSFIIAGMAATGTTILKNAIQVDRGYERIEERLNALGGHIERF